MSENKNDEKPTLTEREAEMLVYYIRTAEGGLPKADWTKFAEMAGFKNANSASVSFANLKKKIMGTTPAAPKTPRKPLPSGKRKQPTPTTKGAEDDDDMGESPSKKAKTTPKKAAKKEAEAKDEADDEGHAAFL